MKKLPRRNCLLVSIFLLLLSGCGYQILNLASEKKVYISVFENLTLQPQMEIYIIKNLREKIMSYPLFNLVEDKKDADIIIEGKIEKFWREPLFFSSEDTRDIVMGRMWIEIEVKIEKGENVWSEKIKENIGVPLVEEYEEEKVLEKLGEEIARKIFFILVKNER